MKRAALVVVFVAACGARSELGAPITYDDDSGADADASDGAMRDATPPSPCHVTEPTLLASGGQQIQFITLDATDVYWTDFSLGTINAISKAGGAPRVIAATRSNPSGLVVTNGKVFWTEFTGGLVASADIAGGEVTTEAHNQDGAYEITASGDVVYWTTLRGCAVARLAPGGSPEVLAIAKQPFEAITSTSALVFWVSLQKKAVDRFDPKDDSVTSLFGATNLPSALATDGHEIYFGTPSTNTITIGALATDGSDSHTVYQSDCSYDAGFPGGCLASLATDGVAIYFTAAADGGVVRKIPVTGGDAITVANDQPRAFSIAVDDACVYWSNLGDGTIWAAPK